jgi:hypothetical protein
MIEFGANPFVFSAKQFCKKNVLIGIDNQQLSTYKVSLPAHF